jgi:hypothetical protein
MHHFIAGIRLFLSDRRPTSLGVPFARQPSAPVTAHPDRSRVSGIDAIVSSYSGTGFLDLYQTKTQIFCLPLQRALPQESVPI